MPIRLTSGALTVGDRDGEARAYHQFGVMSAAEDDYGAAEEWYARAREIFMAVSDQDGLARVHLQLSRLHVRRGDDHQAVSYALRGLQIALEIESPVAGRVLQHLAEVYHAVGHTRFKQLVGKQVDRAALNSLLKAVRVIGGA